MRAIALRLEGPMQSWGGPVAGNDRPSLDVPTKSGVLGLVAGALGIDRREVEQLAALHAGWAVAVRVDRRGTPGVDYHSTLDVPTADGGSRGDEAVISRRRYLYDASFAVLVVERSEAMPVDSLLEAFRRPGFAPFLGRRACPPSVPFLGHDARPLEGEDWRALLDQVPLAERPDPAPHEVHLDAELAPNAESRARRQRDVLIGRLPRLFGERAVHVLRWTPPGPAPVPAATIEGSIDPWFR